MSERDRNISDAEYNERRAIVDLDGLTLDGKPARVFGTLLKFGQVCLSDGSGGNVEFAWPTIKRIVAEKGGKFFS